MNDHAMHRNNPTATVSWRDVYILGGLRWACPSLATSWLRLRFFSSWLGTGMAHMR